MSGSNVEKIPLTREQKAALFLEAQLLLKLCQELLLEARAHHEEDERNLCYPTQVYPAGKPLC
ncbi:MAG: hypothetical protein KGI25_08735 [Thaumarchaeota archaeon]|nr:hypothetical protein [Nitrososphaerota archaeon]